MTATGPRLATPWTTDEHLIVIGIRRGLSYAEIGAELAQKTGRRRPLGAGTVRKYTQRLVAKIEWGEEADGFATLAPRIAVCTYVGMIEAAATTRERFYKSA